MQLPHFARFGVHRFLAKPEVIPITFGFYQVVKNCIVDIGGNTFEYARSGDLIRVYQVGTKAKGLKRDVYAVMDLETARRAAASRITDSVKRQIRYLDFWSARLAVLSTLLERWGVLTDKERAAISAELFQFADSIHTSRVWEKGRAYSKAIKVADLRDSLGRQNPQAVTWAIDSARINLLEYRRVVESSRNRNAAVYSAIESLHNGHKRAYFELRNLVAVGYSTNPRGNQALTSSIARTLSNFSINPWRRPAQEARRLMTRADLLADGRQYKKANELLAQIPLLFSSEKRLSQVVEKCHRIMDLGTSGSIKSRHQGVALFDAIDAKIDAVISGSPSESYVAFGQELAELVGAARLSWKDGNVRQTRKEIKALEQRIRGGLPRR